jgi:hypothetical protein
VKATSESACQGDLLGTEIRTLQTQEGYLESEVTDEVVACAALKRPQLLDVTVFEDGDPHRKN